MQNLNQKRVTPISPAAYDPPELKKDKAAFNDDLAAVEAAGRRVCRHCGQPFKPGRYATRGDFCSDPCRWAVANAKRKTGKPIGRPPIIRTPPDPSAVPDRLKAAAAMIRRNAPA